METFLVESSARLITLPLLILFAITLLLELNHSVFAGLYLLTNDVPFLIPSVVSGLFIFGLSYLGVSQYGLNAVIVVPFFVQLVCNNWYPIYKVKKFFQVNIFKVVLNTPNNLLNTVYGK